MQKFVDFCLPNGYGEEICLSKELAKGPVIILFYRGLW